MSKKRQTEPLQKSAALLKKDSLQRTVTVLEMARLQHPEAPIKVLEVMDEQDEPSILCEESKKVDSYMAKREMTPLQERWNALTMLPSPLWCIYFLVTGKWITYGKDEYESVESNASTSLLNNWLGDEHGCIYSTWALPPLPLVFCALGICLHAPFSFIYHWKYAHSLPAGWARTDHWSRRMDQSMIHTASALLAYATSGSWSYFYANVLYNMDCFYRHWQKKVNPRRNQVRIAVSMLFYTLPIITRGDVALFGKCLAVIALSAWLFILYPLGGWSHSAFHLVIALLPPLIMESSSNLPQSQHQIAIAQACLAR